MIDENLPNIAPISFFQLGFDCHEIPLKNFESTIKTRKYQIPTSSFITQEQAFATLYMGWNLEGLVFFVESKVSSVTSSFPEIRKGDSVEFFIDTRDVKTSGFNTRFCHHFFFLPEAVDGTIQGEITRFRTEDTHQLCTAADLKLDVKIQKKGYELTIFIPSECLYGYDPKEKSSLGFSYRINRSEGLPQHFSALTEEFLIEQQPSLWSSVKMVK